MSRTWRGSPASITRAGIGQVGVRHRRRFRWRTILHRDGADFDLLRLLPALHLFRGTLPSAPLWRRRTRSTKTPAPTPWREAIAATAPASFGLR
jgi:hypothetical protein